LQKSSGVQNYILSFRRSKNKTVISIILPFIKKKKKGKRKKRKMMICWGTLPGAPGF
jgi:hypothetical protein